MKITDTEGREWRLSYVDKYGTRNAAHKHMPFTPSEETVLNARTTICLSQAGESGCSCVKNSKPLGERGYCAGYERAARHILTAIAGSKE